MPYIAQDLARTYTAQWLRGARSAAHRSGWDDRLRCFEALSGILVAYPASRLDGRWTQPRAKPPQLLTRVAAGANFAPEAVFQRWRAEQSGRAIKRWAGPDRRVRPSEAFVAEAKIVSFWPYRQGALAVADVFEMSLPEVAAAYLRALGAWASDNPALAACAPAGQPPCVGEDMRVLAGRRVARTSRGHPGVDAAALRLDALANQLVVAVLDDASLTPLGAFNAIRDETMQLLSEPADSPTVRVMNALSELSDRLLHRAQGERIVSADQIRHLEAEMAGLSSLLASAAIDLAHHSDIEPGEEAAR